VTVQQDLEKAVAAAEAAQGSYMVFSQSTQDPTTKAMYETMATDVTRHVDQLKGRLKYIGTANPLNHPSRPAKRERRR
jgi:bacterioferritin (cytochrome b1)